MGKDHPSKEPVADRRAERDARLAAALRENLRKRKQQKTARTTDASAARDSADQTPKQE